MPPRYRSGWPVPMYLLRGVWAAVSADPAIQYQTLARRFHTNKTAICLTMRTLRDAGYIDFKPRSVGARTIIVPFIELKRNR